MLRAPAPAGNVKAISEGSDGIAVEGRFECLDRVGVHNGRIECFLRTFQDSTPIRLGANNTDVAKVSIFDDT